MGLEPSRVEPDTDPETDEDTAGLTKCDYPSSASWQPTPQQRKRPDGPLDKLLPRPKAKAKRMRRSKPRAGSKEVTPTILHLRDKEITRRHVTLPGPDARKQVRRQPELCSGKQQEENGGLQQVQSEEKSTMRRPTKDDDATRYDPASTRGDLTNEESCQGSRGNGPSGPQPPPIMNDEAEGDSRRQQWR